jgi:uncharacterized FlaG/YvyC family protein
MNTLNQLSVFGQAALARASQPRLDQNTQVFPVPETTPILPVAALSLQASKTQPIQPETSVDRAAENPADALRRVKELAEVLGPEIPLESKLTIRRDEGAGRFVYEFRDPKTDEVVRQFPAKEVLAVLQAMRQPSSGLLLDNKA